MARVTARSPKDPRPRVRVNSATNRIIMLSEKQSQPGMSQSQLGTSQPGSQELEFFFFFRFRDFHTLTDHMMADACEPGHGKGRAGPGPRGR